MVNPWSLAIALIKSISIPVYLFFPFWKTNGAKDESLEITYFDFLGVAFWPAGVVVSGTALLLDDWLSPVHFLMISSSVPSAFIWARALLNSVINFSWLPPFLTPKAKPPTASPSILIARSCPFWMAYWITGWSSITASTAPADKLLYMRSPVSKVLIL